MLLRNLSIAVFLFMYCGHAEAVVRHENFHIRAQESVVLKKGGIQVPKVYVIAPDGALIFEGVASADQAFGPIIKALTSPQKKRSTAPHGIAGLLKKAGFKSEPGTAPVLVTLEIGATIGHCAACDPYYPNLRKALEAKGINARWAHVLFEKNDYKARAK